MKKIIASAFLFVLLITRMSAAVSLDASTTKGQKSVSSITWNHTTVNGATLLVVSVTSGNKSISSVTYNGTALTLGDRITKNSMVTAIYYMISPVSGTKSIVVNASASTDLTAGSETFTGSNTSVPFGTFATNSGTSSTPTLTFSGAIGEYAYQTIGYNGARVNSWGAGQSQLHDTRLGGSIGNSSSTKASAASVTMTATLNKSADWGAVGASIQVPAAPLQVTFLSFNAKPENDVTLLTWFTAAEINNDYYTIERSLDGVHFDVLSNIVASSQSNQISQYQYIDSKIENPVVYYRLLQTDLDGTKSVLSITKIQSVSNEMTTEIYPNPTTDLVNVKFDNEKEGMGNISILDAQGKEVLSIPVSLVKGVNNIGVPMSQLSSGSYFLLLRRDSMAKQSRIIKK